MAWNGPADGTRSEKGAGILTHDLRRDWPNIYDDTNRRIGCLSKDKANLCFRTISTI